MKISADWLSKPSTQLIMQILLSGGHEAFFVGGCVRNALFDLKATDIDISTSATPKRVMELMNQAGLTTIPTGIDYGTVTVVSEKQNYEITTFRKDIETDGRRAKVKYSESVLEDAKRRDFSINAIYSEQDGTILDPLNGIVDIAKKRVKFIGDPYARIKEDYLRILRFFRFLALFGREDESHEIEIAAIRDLRDGLDTISAERKSDEILKLFAAPNPQYSIVLMEAANISSKIFDAYNYKSLNNLRELEDRLEVTPCATRRLAAYTEDNLKSKLRFSNRIAKAHKVLREEAGSKKDAAELSYRYNDKIALDSILVRSSLHSIELNDDVFGRIKLGSAVKFPIKSVDLAEYFSGRKLGEMLACLEQKWIDSDFALSKQTLISTIK
ncbi:MAG: CCA tRNA nucleotidyltransferase [Paracoccaceae bacterium]|nr:CCA tRNA nucleotidyltransferase [Paracoccaceae bacterium]